MAYAIGFMLPFVLIIDGVIWLISAITEETKNNKDVQNSEWEKITSTTNMVKV